MPTVQYSTRNQIESSVICDGAASKAVLYCTSAQYRDVGSGAPSARYRQRKDRSNVLSVMRAI